MFDEGEDVLNRRLPIVVNINGSNPIQRPSRVKTGEARAVNVQNAFYEAEEARREGNRTHALNQMSHRTSQVENHLEDEQSMLRQADQPTVVKHHGLSRK